QILDAGAVIVQQQLGDPAVAVDGQGVVVILAALGDLGLLVGDGDVGAAGLVSLQQGVEVEVDGDVGVAHDHIALFLVFQEAQDGGQSLDAAGVDPHALFCKGRHDVQAAVTAGHIPLAAGAQVVHQGVVVLAHHDGHVGDAAVGHAGEDEVHHAVPPREGDGRHGALRHQLGYGVVIAVGENNAQRIVVLAQHTSSPSLTESNTLAPSFTTAPAPTVRPVPTWAMGPSPPTFAPAPTTTSSARMQRLTTAPALTTTPSIRTASSTVAPSSTTTPADSTECLTLP